MRHAYRLDRAYAQHPWNLKSPRRILVNSMGDLWHEAVPLDWWAEILQVFRDVPQHTYLVLTKRPERMAAWAESLEMGRETWEKAFGNVWLGVTGERGTDLVRGPEPAPLPREGQDFVGRVRA
jgi:protein gp37